MDLTHIAHPDFGYTPNRHQRQYGASAPSEDFLGMKRKMDAVYCAPPREENPSAPVSIKQFFQF